MIESIMTKTEYLTSRQLTSCVKGDLVKRNLNLLPVRVTATFCHPFKINLKIKTKRRRVMAIFKPLKFSIIKTEQNLLEPAWFPPHPRLWRDFQPVPLPPEEKGLHKFPPPLMGGG